MPHRHPQSHPSQAAWVQLLVPLGPSRPRLWALGLLLAAWIAFLLAMYFLTIAPHPTRARPTPFVPVVAHASRS